MTLDDLKKISSHAESCKYKRDRILKSADYLAAKQKGLEAKLLPEPPIQFHVGCYETEHLDSCRDAFIRLFVPSMEGMLRAMELDLLRQAKLLELEMETAQIQLERAILPAGTEVKP